MNSNNDSKPKNTGLATDKYLTRKLPELGDTVRIRSSYVPASYVINTVYDFNHRAGLVSKGYNDCLEASFQIEEALENFDLRDLSNVLGIRSDSSPKEVSRYITHCIPSSEIDDVNRLDKACDAVVFAIGAMTKLGLDPEQINRALEVVTTANNAKLDCPKDDYGKLTKPADFDEKYAPEPKLQAILDER